MDPENVYALEAIQRQYLGRGGELWKIYSVGYYLTAYGGRDDGLLREPGDRLYRTVLFLLDRYGTCSCTSPNPLLTLQTENPDSTSESVANRILDPYALTGNPNHKYSSSPTQEPVLHQTGCVHVSTSSIRPYVNAAGGFNPVGGWSPSQS